jgi:NAD+ kinase
LRELLELLQAQGCTVLLDGEAAALAGQPDRGQPLREIGRQAGLVVVLGGDGTILRVARELEGAPTPILGVNLGGLGFLTSIRADNLARALGEVFAGKVTVSERFTLEASLVRQGRRLQTHRALNDAVISRGAFSRIVRLRVSIQEEWLTEYVCDGMIFATPTGSTAYSLSAGGPILLPEARACILTPICPHALSHRPVVAGEDAVVRCQVVHAAGELLLTVDGQVQVALQLGDEVDVRSSAGRVRLMRPASQGYFDVLRQKLNWSGAHVQTP